MNLYFHTDLETTSLDALTGHIRSIGWVVTDGALNSIEDGHLEEAIPALYWDQATLDWAIQNYAPEYLDKWAPVLGDAVPEYAGWAEPLTKLLEPFYNAVKEMEAEGHKCWLIANHPDFDATMLRAASKITGLPFPFKYNRVLDMASLMMGWDNGWDQGLFCGTEYSTEDERPVPAEPSIILNEYGFTKEAVQHTALEDARRQVEILEAVGLRLPL